MAPFSRSSFIPKSISLSPECRNDPVVLELKVINNNMRKIDAYVVLGLKGRRKQLEDQRKRDTDSKRREKKLSLEKQRKANPINFIKEKLPKTGFLDAIRNFILYTAMGMAVPFALKNLPKILGIVKFIIPFYKLFEDFAGNVLGGIVSAIDFGYKVHDKVRSIFKKVTGDKFEKSFDDLEKNLNTFLNLAVVLGLAVAGSGAIPRPKGGKVPSGFPASAKTLPKGSLSRLNDSYSRFIAGQANIGDRARLVKNGFINVGQAASRGGPDVLAKGAAKTGGKFIGKFGRVFSRVPIVGGLIDFAISMIMGEKPGRAAAKAVGSTFGAALGTFVPFPGVGTVLGGIVGDIVGGALYDTLTSLGKTKKYATGGRVGAKSYSRIPRSIKKAKVKRPPKQVRQRTMPGKNVGGEDNIKKLFPDSENDKTMSSLRLLKKNSALMKRAGVFGNLLSSGVEMMALGQKIERPTLMGLERYLAFVIDSSIEDQTAANAKMLGASMFAMAGGGVVPTSRTISQNGVSTGSAVAKEIVRSFTAMLDNRSSEIFQNIRKELELQGPGGVVPGSPGTGAGDSSPAGMVFNALLSDGYTFEQASGIVGNLMQESGGGTKNLNPKADNGSHYGIAQWDKGVRWPRLVNYLRTIGKDPNTLDGQIAGLIWELKTHEKKAYELIRASSTAEDAAMLFQKEFERSGEKPGQLGYDNRIRFAQQIKAEFSSNVGATGAFGIPQNIGLLYQTNTAGGQYYGAPRPGRKHAGVDLEMSPNSTQITFLGGTVKKIGREVDSKGRDKGYGLFVDILTPTGMIERLAELGTLDPRIKEGATVYPGQIISRGEGFSGVTHLEYRRPGTSGETGTVNPLEYLRRMGVIQGGDTFKYSGPPNKQNPVTNSANNSPPLPSFGPRPAPLLRSSKPHEHSYNPNPLNIASSPQQQKLRQISNIASKIQTGIEKETQILIQPIIA